MKLNEAFHSDQDLLSCGRKPSVVRTLVECVHDHVNPAVGYDGEHLLQTTRQDIVGGLSRAISVCRINPTNYVTTRDRESRKLDKKRCDKVANILLLFVSEVEVEVHYRGLPGLA